MAEEIKHQNIIQLLKGLKGVRFKQEDTKKLVSIIRPSILNFMGYKIGGKK